MRILTGRRHGVDRLRYSCCGRWLAAGGRRGVHVWDLTTPADKPVSLGIPQLDLFGVSDFHFLTDGRLFCIHRLDWYLFRPPDPEPVTVVRDVPYHHVIPTADGRLSVGYDRDAALFARRIDQTGTPWEVWRTEGRKASNRGFVLAGNGRIFHPEHHWVPKPNNQLIDCWVIRSPADGSQLAIGPPFPDLPARLHRMIAFPHSDRVALQLTNSVLICHATDPDHRNALLKSPDNRHLVAVAVHPGEQHVAVITNGRAVHLMKVATGERVKAYEWDFGKPGALAFSPDGTTGAVGSHTGRVLLWDVDV